MKKILFLLPILLVFAPFAASGEEVKMQGRIMEMNLKKNQMTVNEIRVDWNLRTVFFDEKGTQIKLEKQDGKKWAYLLGVRDPVQKRILAEKVYFVPKLIGEKEKSHYPFME